MGSVVRTRVLYQLIPGFSFPFFFFVVLLFFSLLLRAGFLEHRDGKPHSSRRHTFLMMIMKW